MHDSISNIISFGRTFVHKRDDSQSRLAKNPVTKIVNKHDKVDM